MYNNCYHGKIPVANKQDVIISVVLAGQCIINEDTYLKYSINNGLETFVLWCLHAEHGKMSLKKINIFHTLKHYSTMK